MIGKRKDESQGQTQPQPEPEHTLEKVGSLLDEIGQTRLRVIDPDVKVLLTLIAQKGLDYLTLTSGGQPGQVKIMDFMGQLQSLQRVLEQYIEIQNKPSEFNNSLELLQSGREAVEGLAAEVLNKSASVQRSSLTDFKVDTKMLQALSTRNT